MKGYSNILPSGGDTGAPLNLQKRINIISNYISLGSVRILDAGCGSGGYVVALYREGADAYGIEYCKDKVDSFRLSNPGLAHKVTQGNIAQLDYPDGFFDAVLLNEVLEHVPDLNSSLSEILRIIKPDGKLIVFSPNRFYPFETHGVTLYFTGSKMPHSMPLVPYLPLFVGRYLFKYDARNFWPRELRNILEQHGFNVIYSGFVTQTFENISGKQPKCLQKIRVYLRSLLHLFENIPIINSIVSVSQVHIAMKSVK